MVAKLHPLVMVVILIMFPQLHVGPAVGEIFIILDIEVAGGEAEVRLGL